MSHTEIESKGIYKAVKLNGTKAFAVIDNTGLILKTFKTQRQSLQELTALNEPKKKQQKTDS